MTLVSSKLKSEKKLPDWIRVRVGAGPNRKYVEKTLSNLHLNTVCASAKCPNLNECWHKKTATFMIMGNKCTRNCRFCAVKHSEKPDLPDSFENDNIIEAVKSLGLKYVVITSVTRDELSDGGASYFVDIINKIHQIPDQVEIEVLTPDFLGLKPSLKKIMNAEPEVFNHNIETVRKLSVKIRDRADYDRSMKVLSNAVRMSESKKTKIKSGLMLGLGENDYEVEDTIKEIAETGAHFLTIGQYLPPSSKHWPLDRYVEPEKFEYWHDFAKSAGFEFVASAPLVRSSYNAREMFASD